MKLIVQIPCFNEEGTLPSVVQDIPLQIEGVDEVEILVIDDGSTDKTVEVANKLGARVLKLPTHQGLVQAFMAGLDTSLKSGADIIVNTDGDNQYKGQDIPKLIKPILEGRADFVIGVRDIGNIPHFSRLKKWMQKLGSYVVRKISQSDIPDVTSGYRAWSREAALKLNVFSNFSSSVETIIQAGTSNISLGWVPIATNPPTRESRLFRNIWEYIGKSLAIILRVWTIYQPLKVFSILGGFIFLIGVAIGLRFLYFYIFQTGSGHVQSLILCAILIILGFQVLILGVVADLMSANRKLIENNLYRIRKLEIIFDKEKDDHKKT